ncbi:MAG: malQ [Chloroflexi bacterium]|nr:malQ [Chloroflexota bacterium]
MNYDRGSGIILHPTSLPGLYGIGDIGPQAHQWVNFLAQSGCTLWQVLPLGPTGYGDSPYQCFSAFAGNPYLVSPEALLEDDLLQADDLGDMPEFPEDQVDFGAVIPWKLGLLDRAYTRFQQSADQELHQEFDAFQSAQADWLDDFAIFMALKEAHGGGSWVNWSPTLRKRNPQALEKARRQYAEAIRRQKFRQFLFFRQWNSLRRHANELGVRIIGDIPIFVAHDSADVWAHPELFYLFDNGNPMLVAGVPPDYYSETGQLWGNPLYRWDVHTASGYAWWLDRIRGVLSQVDIVRIDHFRGFAGYWEVKGRAKTAKNGHWVPAPGMDLFNTIQSTLGELPIIAEDLGVITPDVVELRDHFGLPGMKVIQFGFTFGPLDPFLPHNHVKNCVAYTGTHDSDTARGWYDRVSEQEKDFFRRYLARDGHDAAWDMIRAVWMSVADIAIAPMQDFLGLGNEARMNYPGNPSGNWNWRMPAMALNTTLLNRLKEINYLYARMRLEPPKYMPGSGTIA